MDNIQKALTYFQNGYNCAASTFAPFAQDCGMDEKTAMRVCGTLGGGLAGSGETCGAVTGALLTLGLWHGMTQANDMEAKQFASKQANIYMQRFKERYDALTCRELLGYLYSDPEGAKKIKELDLRNTKCARYIQSAVEILQEMQQEQK